MAKGTSSETALSPTSQLERSSPPPTSTKKNKKFPFNKQGNLSKQNKRNDDGNNRRTNSDRNENETQVIDNRKRRKCQLCREPHTNLFFCKRLPLYVPVGGNVEPVPPSVCKLCLYTGFEKGENCRHGSNNM